MHIIRVFPRRTNATPNDKDAYFNCPPPMLFPPEADEVHVSCLFSWDKPRAEWLAREWGRYYPVKIGGPAYNDPGGEFVPGRYMKPGYTITSRGCPNHCGFCCVHGREGNAIRLLPIQDGWIVQDNNLLACPRPHIEAVFDMLEKQKHPVKFLGGLEAERLEDWHVERLLRLRRLQCLFTAFDSEADREPVRRAIKMLSAAGIRQYKIQCFVLIGYDRDDTPSKANERCQWVFDLGGLPFASYFRPLGATTKSTPKEWAAVAREWSRPAIIFGRAKRLTTTGAN